MSRFRNPVFWIRLVLIGLAALGGSQMVTACDGLGPVGAATQEAATPVVTTPNPAPDAKVEVVDRCDNGGMMHATATGYEPGAPRITYFVVVFKNAGGDNVIRDTEKPTYDPTKRFDSKGAAEADWPCTFIQKGDTVYAVFAQYNNLGDIVVVTIHKGDAQRAA